MNLNQNQKMNLNQNQKINLNRKVNFFQEIDLCLSFLHKFLSEFGERALNFFLTTDEILKIINGINIFSVD
jgi:GTP cyclohydrolase III